MPPKRSKGIEECELIISIDVGTTHTSVSYSIVNKNQASAALKRDEFDRSILCNVLFGGEKQVSSVLAFVGSDTHQPSTDDWLWGKAAQDNPLVASDSSFIQFVLFKIGYDHSEFSEPVKAVLKNQIAKLPASAGVKTHEDLMTIFLRKVIEETHREIAWHYNNTDGVDVFKAVKHTRTVISVPQLWTYEAKAAMVEAAERAGLINVVAVSEPEAAAMTIRYGPEHYTGPLAQAQLSPSKLFTIVDMGGGTIDIVTYHIQDNYLHQAIPPIGALLGSYRLNEAFATLFWETIDSEKDTLISRWMSEYDIPSRLETYRQITSHVEAGFEEAKKQIRPIQSNNPNDLLAIRIPKIHGKHDEIGIYRGLFHIQRIEIIKLVDKILQQIVDLIQSHINTPSTKQERSQVEQIYFVGGASASQYIRNYLNERLPFVSSPYTDSSTLVSSGALILYLRQNALGERFVPRSLGLAWDEEFDGKLHLGLDHLKVKDNLYGIPRIKNCIHWLFTAKEKIKVGKCSGKQGSLSVRTSPGSHTFRQKVFIAEAETRNHIPIACHGSNIKLFGIVRLTVTNEQKKRFARCRIEKGIDGKSYYVIDYLFRVTYNGALFEYEFIIPRDGQIKKTTNLDDKRICHRASFTLTNLYDRETREYCDESSDEGSWDEGSENSDAPDEDDEE